MKGKDIKPHIGIFGRRNTGKSSLINTLVGQDVAIVSGHAGTTTDPVKKSLEIFGIGPCIIVDTAGIDDMGELGAMRVKKSLQVLDTIDLAILLVTHNNFNGYEADMIRKFAEKELPFIVVHNKSDIEELAEDTFMAIRALTEAPILEYSNILKNNTNELIDIITATIPENAYQLGSLFGGIIRPDDIVLLITPIDSEAPEGRMILPQVMAIRDVLDNNCVAIVVKETEVERFLTDTGIKPKLAVTDSQVFHKMKEIIPEDVMLTSFSIVFARYRGSFEKYLEGTRALDKLSDGNKVLILESCTHRVSCDDIGRFKLPGWIRSYSGKKLEFITVAGLSEIPSPLDQFAIVIQCGGCVATKRQLARRLQPAIDLGIPVSNYGMAIAYVNGIFNRAVEPFIRMDDERED